MTSPFAARFFSFRTPLRFLRGSYTRLTLTVIAIACGVALVCAIDLADRAVMRAFVEVMGTAAGRVALQVRAGAGAPFPEEVAATVAGVPGRERARGRTLAILGGDGSDVSFTHPGFINWVDVVVEGGKDVAAVADAIGDALPAGLQVQAPGQRKVDMQKLVRSLEVMLEAVGLLGLVAAFLIAFNRLGTVFEARAWQLGVLRAVGARSRVVWWELLKESLLIGGAGVALGIPLGIGFGRLLIPVIATSASLAYKLIAPDAELTVRAAS